MKSKKSIVKLVLILCLIVILTAGCSKTANTQNTANSNSVVITDMLGRDVEISLPAKRIVAIGPGALRLVCYVNGASKVVGVENAEKQWPSSGRTYIMAYPELKELPVIGPGGADSAPDAEKLAGVKPDVIFVTYLVDKTKADELQAKTGIPVVVLSYGKFATFDEDVFKSLNIIGKIIGEEKRANEVVEYIKKCQQDLDNRTKDIPDEKKPKVYVGALGMKGGHGIESTQANFPPFKAVNAKNVADETGQKGSIMIEKEKLIAWDPDIIFIDENNLNLVKQDYDKNTKFYNSLKAFKEKNVYGFLPYNYYTTNIDTAIADAYWIGKVIYPERFNDIDPAKKADEIYTFFLNKPLYNQMAEIYGGFKKLDMDN